MRDTLQGNHLPWQHNILVGGCHSKAPTPNKFTEEKEMNNTRKSGNYNNFSHALQVGSQGEAAFRELISRKEGYSFDDVTETEEFQK